MNKKRSRMVLNAEDMPNDVYNILNKKALSRSLTPYIIELVKKDLDNNLILSKLDMILSKLDNIKVIKSDIESDKGYETLKEGEIFNTNGTNVKGGISTEDLNDEDYNF